jgi:hypothetical protein
MIANHEKSQIFCIKILISILPSIIWRRKIIRPYYANVTNNIHNAPAYSTYGTFNIWHYKILKLSFIGHLEVSLIRCLRYI